MKKQEFVEKVLTSKGWLKPLLRREMKYKDALDWLNREHGSLYDTPFNNGNIANVLNKHREPKQKQPTALQSIEGIIETAKNDSFFAKTLILHLQEIVHGH